MTISKEFVENVRSRIVQNPTVSAYILAKDFGVSEVQVLTALPVKMRQKAKPENFKAIWQAAQGWRNLRFFETAAADAKHGNSNVQNSNVQNSNVQNSNVQNSNSYMTPSFSEEELGYIWFVSKPEQETESHSVQFFGKAGQHLLSLYLGHNDNNELDPHDKAAYNNMREHFGVTPVPRRCQGCSNCSCGNKQKAHTHSH